MISRRRLLQTGGAAGVALLAVRRRALAGPMGFVPPNLGLAKFVDALTYPPVASPDTLTYPGSEYYHIGMRQYTQKMHRDLPATKLWGYTNELPAVGYTTGYLGPLILARSTLPGETGKPVKIKFENFLPATHILPVDHSIAGTPLGNIDNRTAVHLHGGRVPWQSDGHPLSWTSPGNAIHGEYWGAGMAGEIFDYPNGQSARLMWYHDHAVSITRLNAYAGLAAGYVLRDRFEDAMITAGTLPGVPLVTEIPLIIQDKAFNADGTLWYPDTQNPADLAPPLLSPLPDPSVVPEFFGNVNLVNGVVWPYLNLERKKYRFRILNGNQARFYRLKLYYAQSNNDADPNSKVPNLAAPGPAFYQIGTEGGFLPAPVMLNNPANPSSAKLMLAPAERADIIIDFQNVPNGARLILYNDAAGPFPSGDPVDADTSVIMQLRVSGTQDTTPLRLPVLPPFTRLTERMANKTRYYTLNEGFDEYGRLIQLVGTNVPYGGVGGGGTKYGQPFLDLASGLPLVQIAGFQEPHKNGDIEVWYILNLTGDTHPMHTHLVTYQILSRQAFDVNQYLATGTIRLLGPAMPPEPNEVGWKETGRMNPGQITKIAMRFDALPEWVGGHYVWHCHILEHEEHDMMRGLELA